MDVSTLVVKVESKGIDTTSKSLDGLGKSAESAEKYVQSLMDRMSKASAPVQAIISNMNNLRSAMNGAIPTNSITAATTEFKKMSEELRKITDGLGKGVGKGVTVNIKEIGEGSKEAVKGVESLNQSLTKGQNVFQVFGKELYHIRNLLGGTMLAHAMLEAAKASVALADSWTLANAKLMIFVGSATMAAHSQERLYQVSQELRVPMEDVTTLFTRLVPAMKEYGYNTESAMSVTRAMAAALQISGATTAEMSSVMLQFSQSMAAGRLNGAEFNAVAEGAPIVLRALSEALGVSRGALKKMAADGLLPTTVLTEVLKGKMEEWENQQKSMPLTVGKAWTSLTDSFSRFIGKMNEGVGVTGLIAKSIKLIGDNLSNITNTIAVGVVAWGTYSAAMMVYNMWLARSVALNTSLAASLGITTVATTAAAGATGLLSSAMAFLLANPIVLTLTAIAAAMGAIYLWTDKAATAQERFTELDTSGDKTGAMKVLAGEVERVAKEYDNLIVNMARLNKEREIAQRLGAGTSSQTAQLDALQKKLMSVAKSYSEALKALQDYKREQEKENVKQATEGLDKQIAILEKEISLKRDLTDTEKKLDDATKSREALGERTDANKELFKSYDTQIVKLSKVIDLEKIRSNQRSASKTSKSPEESFDKKYDKLTEKLKLFITTQEEELGLRRKLTAAESEALKISEFIENNRSKMTAGEAAALDSARKRILLLGEQKVSQDKINTALDEYYVRIVEIANEESTAMSTSFKIKEDSLQRQQVLMSDIQGTQRSGLSLAYDAMEADKRKIQSINDQITKVWELKAAKLEAEGFEALARGDDVAVERISKAIEAVYKRIAALKLEKGSIAENNAELEKQAELLYQISQLNMAEIGRTPGDILAEGFGTAGKAISGMMESYDKFGEQSKRVNAELAGQLKHLAATGASPDKIAQAEDAAAEKRLQINAQMYAGMAGAAKGYFKQQSTAYKVLENTEKAFRAIELAMALKSMLFKLTAIETTTAATVASVPTVVAAEGAKATAAAPAAVANAAQMPGPLAFAGAAAMIALLAGLGIAIAGGGGGSSPNIAAERQASAGTGSVLGDASAKSESTVKALEAIKENSSISARYNEGMLSALKNIESALAGASKSVIKSGVQGKVSFAEGMGKTTESGMNNVSGAGASLATLSIATLGIGSVIKSIGNALFSLKKSVVDSGIVQMAQSLGSISDSGLNVSGYTTIETKKKKWGKTKTSTEENLTSLDAEIKDQLSKVVLSMSDGIKSAAKVLGLDNQAFVDSLNSFVVDIGHISLQGLSPEKIQEQFTNIFSKMGDDMAKSALPQLEKFQNVGEGYLETLIRVASTVATVDGIFQNVGTTFGQLGLAGVEAKMHLIDLAGGLEGLSGLVSDFFGNFYTEAEQKAILLSNVNQKLVSLGIAGLDITAKDGRMAFRKIVEQYKDTNSEVFIELLKLQESVSKIAPAFEDEAAKNEKASEALAEALAKQQELRDKLAILEGKGKEVEARKRQEELGALDATSKAIQLRIWELEDEKVAIAAAAEAAKVAAEAARKDEISSLNQLISVQQDYVSSLEKSADGINNLIGDIDSLASSGMAMLGMTPKVKSLVENFNSTDESIRSLSETLDKFTATTVLSLSDRLTNLVEQDKAILDFQSNLKGMIGNLRFESLSLEDRISSLKTLERKLFGEINGADNPLEVAKHLQEVITQRYSLEEEYQNVLLDGQKQINETTKSNLKQQIDTLHNTKDFLTSLKAFTNDIKISELSILSPEKQLGEVSQQFYETLAKAKTGDTQAQAGLTNLAKSLLDEAKGFYASTTGYVDVYNQVMSALGSFEDMANIDPQITLLEKQLSTLDALAATTDSLKEQQIADLERVSDTLNNTHIENKIKQQELIDALKSQISELKTVQENQIAQIRQQLAIRDESNIKLDEANGKLTSMRDSLKLLERK